MSFLKKLFSTKENKEKDSETVSPGNTSRMSHMELLVLVAAPESTKTKEELMKLGASADSRIRKEQLVALAKYSLLSHTSKEERQILIGVSICTKCDKATTYTTIPGGKKDMPPLCLNCKNAATMFTWWEAPILHA